MVNHPDLQGSVTYPPPGGVAGLLRAIPLSESDRLPINLAGLTSTLSDEFPLNASPVPRSLCYQKNKNRLIARQV